MQTHKLLFAAAVMLAGVVHGGRAHADDEIAARNVLTETMPQPVKRGKPGLVVTGIVLSTLGTVSTATGLGMLFSTTRSATGAILAGVALATGVGMLGGGIPLIVYGATAKRKPRAQLCVSMSGVILSGSF